MKLQLRSSVANLEKTDVEPGEVLQEVEAKVREESGWTVFEFLPGQEFFLEEGRRYFLSWPEGEKLIAQRTPVMKGGRVTEMRLKEEGDSVSVEAREV